MDRGDFASPSDETTLSLENQLLLAEARLLRARVAGIDDEIASIRASYEGRIASLETQVQSSVSAERYEELRQDRDGLRQAERDLKWLLKRLRDSAFGFVITRRKGFQALARRYLDDA